MRCSIRACLSVALIGFTPFGFAHNDWTGVWQGSIGKEAVIACFPASASENPRYYYLKQGNDLELEAGPNAGEWTERSKGGGRGTWKLSLNGKDLLGEWTGPAPKPRKSQKGKPVRSASPAKHAIKLAQVPVAGSQIDICSSDAYTLPRLEQQKIATGKQLSWQGKLYRTYSSADGKVRGLELVFADPKHPNAQRINKTLLGHFRDHLNWYLRCRSDAGASGNWQYGATPVIALWSRYWLTVVEDSVSYCGSTYSNRTHEARLYDLRTGEAVDALTWFQTGTFRLIDQTQTLSSSSALGKIVKEQAVRQSQRGCRDALEENQWYKVWPARTGMVFYPDLPPIAAACANDIVVPYGEVRPFLTYDAQAAIRELQQEFK